ncbi:MAG: radical SAM protein [Pirellulales bacterium]
MNCNSNHSVFLRSNGSLACWCDYGSLKTLQEFDPNLDYGADVYLGRVYGHIRDSLAAERMPFPEFCSKCLSLCPDAPFTPHYRDHRQIDVFQVETSLACQLECPGCMTKSQRPTRIEKTRFGHLLLDAAVLEKILADLARAGIGIRQIDFQGHGEPLLNKNAWTMVATAKRLFPASRVTMCTNANVPFAAEMAASGLDEITFAIDGVDQQSYAAYRIGGDFETAYAFMQGFCRESRRAEPKPPGLWSRIRGRASRDPRPEVLTRWKYVLFSHNDSREQLLRAQEMAVEAGVSRLEFVITQLGDKSTRIVDESQIPLLSPETKNLIRINNYKVSYEQVARGLELAESRLAAGDLAEAGNSAVYVATMLGRLFANGEDVPDRYRSILEGLRGVIQRLPEDSRGRARQAAGRLLDSPPAVRVA